MKILKTSSAVVNIEHPIIGSNDDMKLLLIEENYRNLCWVLWKSEPDVLYKFTVV